MFEEVQITWNGVVYKIAPNRVMQCIAKVEDHITLGELIDSAQSGKPPLAKLAGAFAAILRHAGARVAQEEIYTAMFKNTGNATQVATEAVNVLLSLMVPPEAVAKKMESTVGKDNATTAPEKATPEHAE